MGREGRRSIPLVLDVVLVGLIHLLLLLLTATLRAAAEFRGRAHSRVVRALLGLSGGEHRVGSGGHAFKQGNGRVDGRRVRLGWVRIWRLRLSVRRGVLGLASHVGSTEVAGNLDGITQGHAVVALLAARCGTSARVPLSLVLQVLPDEERSRDDDGQKRQTADGNTNDGTGGHSAVVAMVVIGRLCARGPGPSRARRGTGGGQGGLPRRATTVVIGMTFERGLSLISRSARV